jgi:hypothetical protein
MTDFSDLEVRLKSLLKGSFSSLSIAFNDANAPSYMTVGEMVESGHLADWDTHGWVSEDERKRAIALNSMWSVQWYPQTPIGFCVVHASSLTAALNAALEENQ